MIDRVKRNTPLLASTKAKILKFILSIVTLVTVLSSCCKLPIRIMESLGTAAPLVKALHCLGPNHEKENLWKVLVGEIYKIGRVRRTRTVWLGPQTKLFSHERVLEQQQQPPLISEESIKGSSLPIWINIWIFQTGLDHKKSLHFRSNIF